MKTRNLIVGGGCGLAFGVSVANTGLVLHTGTSVSHLTGDIAKMTINLARWSPPMLADLCRVSVAAGCFFIGAIVAGAIIHHPSLDISRPYGRTITGIGFLFLLAFFSLGRFPLLSIGLAALGCGLQNSLATHYRGIVLRTTHLTGLFTDFGVTLGMRLRGYDVPSWKIGIPFLLIFSFFLGGLFGATVHLAGFDAIKIAGIGYVIAGLGWSVLKHRTQILNDKGTPNKAGRTQSRPAGTLRLLRSRSRAMGSREYPLTFGRNG
jgi:uncharacterized membrane protein YoaK (UPF0700 family)